MGTGADLDGIEEWELRSILESSSRSVDAYCCTPFRPDPYSFRGGSVTNEAHDWNRDTVRIYFDFKPVRAITSFKVYASNTVSLTVAPDQIYLNEKSGWAEVVATQYSLTGSVFPMMPFWGLGTPLVRTNYDYGWWLVVTGEYLEPTDARLYRATNQFWVSTEDVTVYVNGSEADPDDYTIDYEEGTILFDPSLTLDDVVTVDYVHHMPFNIARATALIASTSLSERDLTTKGMGQLAEITVEEVRLRRDARRTGTVVAAESIPDAAKTLLNGYKFITVR